MPGFLDELLSLPILDNSQREAAASRFTPGMSRDRIVSELLELEWITAYQAQALRSGRGRDLVVGSYIIRRPIGAGGMGHVFEAWQPLFGKAVALKVIHRDRLNEPTAIARFEREIRAIARVSHPNIVAVHHADRHEEAFYLTMELVAGTTLDQLLASQGPFPIPDACDAVRQAAEGLQHIHEQGLVHRDIKPSNLIRAASGATKILDLGLALLPSAATLTTRGQSLIGTVDYIAPEQVTAPHTTDIRADIYSLGCTLYHILTGRVLFPEAHPCARPYLHQVEMPIPATSLRPEIPARLGEVLGRMLAKRRDDRYSTPNEVAAVLAPFALRPAPIRLGECIGGWWIEEGLPGAGRAGYFRAVRKDEQALVQIIPDRALRPDEAERFVATWSALSGIRASALPVVKEVGRDRACRFVALDLPQGVWLDELLAETGGLTPERACELVLHVSEGLAEAHKHGVIHGNLRPSVVVYRPGGAVLVGFGLPLAARVAPVATGARLSGRHLAFAAPEQVRKGRAETSSDVYGLAGLLFHAINAALGEKSEPDYYDSALVPAGLRDLLGRCLSADPSRRPATAAEFAAQLRAACGPPKVRIGIPGRWMSRPAAGGAEWVAVESAAGFVMEHGRAYSFKAHRELDDVALTGFGRLDPDAPLVRIDLRGTRVTDAGLAHIAHLTAVERLDLGYTTITGAGLRRLQGWSRLRSLDLGRSRLGIEGCRPLAALAALADVSVEGCKDIDDTTFADLVRLPCLTTLSAAETPVTDAGLRELGAAACLQRLMLDRCPKVTDSGVAQLGGLTELVELRLAETRITDTSLGHLHSLAKLTVLELGGTSVGDPGIAHLRKLTGLTHLDLSNTQVTDGCVANLARMGHLRYLSLWRCEKLSANALTTLRARLPQCRIMAG